MVDVLDGGEDLNVDEIVGSPAGGVPRAGVELLSDLVLGADHSNRRRLGQSDLVEDRTDVGTESFDRYFGAVDLGMNQLQHDGAVGLPEIPQLDAEAIHDVLDRDVVGAFRLLGLQYPGESCPPDLEPVAVRVDEVVELHSGGTREVEIGGQPCLGLAHAMPDGAATLGGAIRNHLHRDR
jgi:hypothetical protein